MPRKVILDTQGRAVEKTLEHHGKAITQCRVGRFVELEFSDLKTDEAMARAKEIAEFVLHNPLIEDFELVQLKDNA
jgi:phosphoribosylformylglycinamidine synthase subunit PurS